MEPKWTLSSDDLPQLQSENYLDKIRKVASVTQLLYKNSAEAFIDVYERSASLEHRKVLEPRQILTPHGYYSSREPAAATFTILEELPRKLEEGALVPRDMAVALDHYRTAEFKTPIYYVSESLAREIIKTKLPTDLLVEELEWPLDAFVTAWPVTVMEQFFGFPLCHIYATKLTAKDYQYPLASANLPTISVTAPKVSWHALTFNKGIIECFSASYAMDDSLKKALEEYQYTDHTGRGDMIVDRDSVNKMSHLMFGLLLTLRYVKGLVSHGERVTKEQLKRGGEYKAERWSPTFIGRPKRVSTELAKGQGSHTSPHWHWRLGHWTWQPKGKRNQLVSIKTLPRTDNGDIDWSQVPEATKAAFLASHERKRIAPVLVNEEQVG